MMKKSLAAGALMLAATLPACGGGDGGGSDAPTGASTEDFCKPIAELMAAGADLDGGDIKKLGESLAKVGTPKGISDEQREGFELFVKKAAKVDGDETLADLSSAEGYSAEDGKKVAAFGDYFATECAASMVP